MDGDWLQPAWPAPTNVRAACSTRAGGLSAAPYDGLNLGDHVGDAPAAVAANRHLFAQALGARPVYLRQVHGRGIAVIDAQTVDGIKADGCVTVASGVACTIMVADCLPVLITDLQGRAVGAAHAGWRGLAGEGHIGVLEATCAAFWEQAGLGAQDAADQTLAWLGPCIGPEKFEVGHDVRTAFVAHEPAASALFTEHGQDKWLADLAGLARQRLQALGVTRIYGNDRSPAWCTVGNPSRFFSYRRDRVSGRFAASIWRT